MKLNKPSLILYFIVFALVVLFKILGWNAYVLYAKSLIIPLLFVYYFITNNYSISWLKALILLLCFIGDLFNLLQFEISPLGALISFLLAYVLLLKLAFDDFRGLKFNERDHIPIFVLFVFVAVIFISILSLNFENMIYDISLYVIYGIVLSVLVFVSSVNFIKNPNYGFMNLAIMCICSMVSDVFFVINSFYLSLYTFSFIQVTVQAISYFFMINYFIENDKYLLNTKRTNL